ncbi:hypothetical protein [Brevibacillus laterosporus]|uniref:hypothetical protein n=1 Tax=Brevibacillus laterosporus TaxID=1465 RepID=UPI003D22C7B3
MFTKLEKGLADFLVAGGEVVKEDTNDKGSLKMVYVNRSGYCYVFVGVLFDDGFEYFNMHSIEGEMAS